MATTDQSPEARELSLVGKVELRIALADNDDKFENVLKTYLPPLLLKLGSPHINVRNKVIGICSHINTRIKPQTIKLPVAALVEQFKTHQNSSLIRHFDLVYIQHGVRRMSSTESETLFPIVIKGVAANSRESPSHAAQMFNLVLQLIGYFKLPGRGTKEDTELRTELQIGDEDAAYLADWIGKLLLLVPGKPRAQGASSVGVSCFGLTPDEYDFLTNSNKDDTWNPSTPLGLNLTTTKSRVARLLASGIFKDSERFFPALFAAADPASAVSDTGEDMLKRTLPNTDLEDPHIVRQLFHYFFGEDVPGGRIKARARLRLRIFGLLSKSTTSTSFTDEIVTMVNQGIADSSVAAGPDAMQIDGQRYVGYC